jgi:hypothetical protein
LIQIKNDSFDYKIRKAIFPKADSRSAFVARAPNSWARASAFPVSGVAIRPMSHLGRVGFQFAPRRLGWGPLEATSMRNPRRYLSFMAALVVGLAGDAAAARTVPSQRIQLERGPMPVEKAFRLKAAMGEAAFSAEVKAAVGKLVERTEKTDRCASPAETGAAAQMELVRLSRDAQAYARSLAAAEAALAQRGALRTLYLGGAEAARPYGLVRRMVARAKAESNPRLVELYRRMAEDQFSHIDSLTLKPFLGPGVHTTWESGLDDAGLAYVDAIITGEWCPMKISNVSWLKADLRDHGWYKISIYGGDADSAAWLIVQHGRHDLGFQEDVVAMLEPLWRAGETRGDHFAMLYDQTAQYNGRPGRFGVIGECTAPGVWTPAAVEDKGATDQWRAKAGLPPMAEYVAASSRGCTD